MKRLITTIVVLLLMAVNAWAVITPEYYPTYNQELEGRALGGEHTAVIWSGTEYLPKASAAEQATDWIQYGYSPDAVMVDANLEFHTNPEVFNLDVWLDSYPTNAAGDSCILVGARFEYADSIDAVIPFWDADSSNCFLLDGFFGTTRYNQGWAYEDFVKTLGTTADNKGWTYRLRVSRPGGCLRLIFWGATTMDDSTRIRWKLRGEN